MDGILHLDLVCHDINSKRRTKERIDSKMSDINFVPDEYVENNESHRTNLICLVLFSVIMVGLLVSFTVIKLRQRTYTVKEKLVDAEIARRREAIVQAESLQQKSIEMWKTALTTAELLEPVSRSVLLASLTNNLPSGVSLLRLNLIQKKDKQNTSRKNSASKYQKAKSKASQKGSGEQKVSLERLLKTHIDIEGIAPSDLQVAMYIERLSNSNLISNVALVESKEHAVKDTTFRQFKLTAMLKAQAHVTEDDVKKIAMMSKL